MARFHIDRKWWMLAIALAAGAAAAWLSQRHIQARMEQLEEQARTPLVSVVVAAGDLAAGSRLTSDSVAVRDVPAEWASPSAVGPDQFEAIESATLAHPVARGEPILWAHVEQARAKGFSERLADGRRAVTIPVDEISSVSGLLQPGDAIDLYVSFDHRGSPVTVPLLQGMKVLATGRQVDASTRAGGAGDADRAFSTVTLDASLDEAVKLIAARQGGSITAMLRRPGDSRPARAEYRGDLGKLLGLQEPPPEAVSRKRTSVPVIYGDRPLRSIPRLGGAASEDVQDETSRETVEAEGRDAAQALPRVPASPLSAATPANTPATGPDPRDALPGVPFSTRSLPMPASRAHPFPGPNR